MKTIGLIGGMSWESTVPYYRQINEAIKERLGGLHSAKLVLYSVDFDEIERLQHSGDWEAAGAILVDAARSLEAAGAAFLVLCTNTMHKVAPSIEASVGSICSTSQIQRPPKSSGRATQPWACSVRGSPWSKRSTATA